MVPCAATGLRQQDKYLTLTSNEGSLSWILQRHSKPSLQKHEGYLMEDLAKYPPAPVVCALCISSCVGVRASETTN